MAQALPQADTRRGVGIVFHASSIQPITDSARTFKHASVMASLCQVASDCEDNSAEGAALNEVTQSFSRFSQRAGRRPLPCSWNIRCWSALLRASCSRWRRRWASASCPGRRSSTASCRASSAAKTPVQSIPSAPRWTFQARRIISSLTRSAPWPKRLAQQPPPSRWHGCGAAQASNRR